MTVQPTSSHSTHLNGLFEPGFMSDSKVVIEVTKQQWTPGTFRSGSEPRVNIFDGRELQAEDDDSASNFPSRFFKQHGFVLLHHDSKVKDWDSGAFPATDSLGDKSKNPSNSQESVNEIALHYLPEVDHIIRNILLPGENVEIQQYSGLLRRGKNSANPFFGQVVHNDYGITADDYQENAAAFGTPETGKAWRDRYESDDVRGFMMINFWRTVHMRQPLQHMPLAVLDASTVEPNDLVLSGLKGFTFTGRVTTQLSLRYNEDQRWYYYPRMTTSEVLVLNLFEFHKDSAGSKVYNSYHSAFEEPHPSGEVEERQSCEHRVNVFLLKD